MPSFSALQRAENSSILTIPVYAAILFLEFQCSSASRKFLNAADWASGVRGFPGFSALQRAENSSMDVTLAVADLRAGFSALQRAENSSIVSSPMPRAAGRPVSVLFSEPKIPQCSTTGARIAASRVSVLFSEPKIPQFSDDALPTPTLHAFQCSSASRKFLNPTLRRDRRRSEYVSVLFSEPKIPQSFNPSTQRA